MLPTNKHGLPIFTKMPTFTEATPKPGILIKRGVPANLLARGLNTVKNHHYPTAVLHKLQKGCCFYCDKEINRGQYHRDKNQNGTVKGHLYPRSAHYTLYGNKVLTCGPCGRWYKEEMPTADHVAYFDWLYSPEVFVAEFGVKDSEDNHE